MSKSARVGCLYTVRERLPRGVVERKRGQGAANRKGWETPVGTSYTRMQTARASVRRARAEQLAQGAERKVQIEKTATAVVLTWQARQHAAERLATADKQVSAQLRGLVMEKLSVSEIAALTGIPQRNRRTLIRGFPQDVTAAQGSRDVQTVDKCSNTNGKAEGG